MRILIADDEPRFGYLLASQLEEEGHFVKTVTNGEDALDELSNSYDLLITDLKMPGMNGLELLEKVQKIYSGLPVVFMTAYASVKTAVSAMKFGAIDYLKKPFKLEEMVTLVKRIESNSRMKNEIDFRRNEQNERINIIGKSQAIKKVLDMANKVANTDTTVLILGESGTGKELIAKLIHSNSKRKNHPFIAINCASLPENLLESELFGYEKGAFTGAEKRKPGRFFLADGGTLFLDEIGELPAGTQAKLLRALQEKVINPIGSVNPVKIDIRLIAATNRDLEQAIEKGEFREDLYYRLAVFPIFMPALEQRKQDIPLLIDYFLDSINYSGSISSEAVEQLSSCRWKGNIRELFNVLERATILAEGNQITSDNLPYRKPTENNLKKALDSDMSLEEIERSALLIALKKCNGNKTEAAKKLGITRRMVYSRMKAYNISNEEI